MMEWANQKVDEMNIEDFIEALELEGGLFEKWEYRVVMKLDYYQSPTQGDWSSE